jgi:peroxiredoxin family protein
MTTTQTGPAIVPVFDDDEDNGRKLAIICSKGNLDMAYPGLIIANAALGEGVETHLFFTFWGFDMITKSRMHDLQFSPVGNTAMHPVGDAHMPQALTPMPGMTAMATRMLKKSIADLGVPEIPDFLDQIVAAGGHLWACRMSADMNKLTDADLRDDVEGIINAAEFIELTSGAQLLFIRDDWQRRGTPRRRQSVRHRRPRAQHHRRPADRCRGRGHRPEPDGAVRRGTRLVRRVLRPPLSRAP